MNNPNDDPRVSVEMAEQVMRQGEVYLQSQLQAALASDQRALTMAAFFSSVGAAVAAGAIAYWDKSGDLPILIGGLVGAGMMVLGACVCLWTARPVDFYYPGNHPQSWFNVLRKPLYDVMLGEAENYQDHIEANEQYLSSNGGLLIKGAAIAIAAPVIGVVLWAFLTTACPSCRAGTDQAATRSQSSLGETLRSLP